jgi:hypothetical protein
MTAAGTTPLPPPPRWAVALGVVVVVLVGGLLARSPGPGGDEVPRDLGRPGQLEVREADPGPAPARVPTSPPEPAPPTTAVLHALNTASLMPRVDPVEVPLHGRTLHSAVSSRGRQLLVLAYEDPESAEVEVEVRDSSGLAVLADLGVHAGPMERLAVTGDGTGVLWVRPGGPGESSAVTLVGLPRRDLAVDVRRPPDAVVRLLPPDVAIRDLRGLPGSRVAVLGVREGDGPPRLQLVLLDMDETDGGLDWPVVVPLDDVGEGAGPGMVEGRHPVRPRAAHVWDDRRQLLHIAHAAGDALTSIDLRDGRVRTDPVPAADPAVVRRSARMSTDGDRILVTGTLTRPNPRRGIAFDETLPLEPLVFEGGYGSGQLVHRGDAQLGEVVAAGRRHAAIAAPRRLEDGQLATELRVVDLDLEPVRQLLVTGEVSAAAIDHAGLQVLLTRTRRRGGVVVSDHPIADGTPVERHFAPGSIVHLEAVVVIELR